MGTAGVHALRGRRSIDEAQANIDKSQDPVAQRSFLRLRGQLERQERQEQERAAAAALSAAEKAAAQKTSELANSAGRGINTNGQGSSSYTEGNPGQDDNKSQGDVDLSTSDTTLRRRGGYRRDAGISI